MSASPRPTRATVEGRAYLDLQNLARRQQRPTDELQQLYALEGFLTRLSRSPHAHRLVLKGCVLLASYDALQRGTANTRWRDFADIYILTRRHTTDASCNAHLLRSPPTDAPKCPPLQTRSTVTPPSARPVGQRGGANSISTTDSHLPSRTSSKTSSRSPIRR